MDFDLQRHHPDWVFDLALETGILSGKIGNLTNLNGPPGASQVSVNNRATYQSDVDFFQLTQAKDRDDDQTCAFSSLLFWWTLMCHRRLGID